MDAVATVGLAELGYLERELSWSVEKAAVRLPDDDLKRRVRDFGETHARHADEVDRIMRSQHAGPTHVPDDFKRTVRKLTEALTRAGDLASTLVALVQAERRIVDFYDVPLREQLPGNEAAALQRQQRAEQVHVDYLEERGAVLLPELADLGDADGAGSAEEV
jgi:hypothetical protein